MATEPSVEEMWRALLTGENPQMHSGRHLYGMLPSNPRCKVCNAPFGGIGAQFMRFTSKRRSKKNPNFCNVCEQFAKNYKGGAEVVMTMLFADVRGSTTLAEQMSPSEFTRLMNRFYTAANQVLTRTDAFVDKLVGDEIIGHYIPGFCGAGHASLAIEAAQELLHVTGHGTQDGPWLPIGVGVHTGLVYFGVVGDSDGYVDFTAMGDNVNVTARLTGQAREGEALISDAAYAAAGLKNDDLERRALELKGKSEVIGVRVLHAQKH
jgi:adenylate cyclase